MPIVYVQCFYGLGRRLFSAQMEDYVAASLRKIPNVICGPTRGYGEWEKTVEEFEHLGTAVRRVAIGHSMGGPAATYITDETRVDLVVCYDAAGQRCSGIGRNCGKLLDFQDRSLAIVPKFRPWAYSGHGHKILLTQTRLGHVGQPSSPELLVKVVREVRALAA